MIEIADICRLNIFMIEWREGKMSVERAFQDLMAHFNDLSSYNMWPTRLAFEEFKWRSEFFYIAAEFFRLIGRDSVQCKFFSLKMIENYVKNRELQISKFEDGDAGGIKGGLSNPFADQYAEEDSKEVAKWERNSNYYGCINGKYPTDEGGIPLAKGNEESLEKRVEIEKFSKVKYSTLKELDEAIQSCQNISLLQRSAISLKLLRKRIFKFTQTGFVKDDLALIWPWEDLYNSRPQ